MGSPPPMTTCHGQALEDVLGIMNDALHEPTLAEDDDDNPLGSILPSNDEEEDGGLLLEPTSNGFEIFQQSKTYDISGVLGDGGEEDDMVPMEFGFGISTKLF